MTAPNLLPRSVAIADYPDRAATLAAGWIETGGNGQISTANNSAAWPAGTQHYVGTCVSAGNMNFDSPELPIDPSGTYSFGFYQKTNTGTVRNVRADVRFYDASHTSISTLSSGGSTPAAAISASSPVQITRLNVTSASIPPTAAYMRLRILVVAAAVGDSLSFGDVQVEAGATLSAEIIPPADTGSGGTNLFSIPVATAQYTDAAAVSAAGWLALPTNNAQIGVEDNGATTWPAGTRHYLATSIGAGTANYDSPPIPVDPTKVYSWGVYQKWKTGTTPKNVRLDLRYFDAAGIVLTTGGTSTGTGVTAASSAGAPVQIKRENVTPPPGAVTARLRFAVLSGAVGDVVSFGDVQAEQAATLSSNIVPPTPTEPTGVFRFGVTDWLDTAVLIDWDSAGGPVTGTDTKTIRNYTNAPANSWDAQVQSGDISGFVTATTWAQVAAAASAGTGVYVNTVIQATSQARCDSGFGLYLGPSGRIVRAVNGSADPNGALFINKNTSGGSFLGTNLIASDDLYFGTDPNNPGRIEGASGLNGGIFGLAGDNIVIEGIKTTYFQGGRHTNLIGRHGRVRRVDWRTPVGASSGEGGLRYMGGSDFRCIDSHIESGDDVYQCVPGGSGSFWDVDIDDVIYLGNTGESYTARLMVCGLQRGATETRTMTSSVTNVRFIENNGFSRATGINLANHDSTGEIAFVSFERCTVDGSRATITTGQQGAIYFMGEAGGGVHDISFTDVKEINFRKKGIYVSAGTTPSRLYNISFKRGQLERSTLSTTEVIADIRNCANFTLDGVTFNRRGSATTNGSATNDWNNVGATNTVIKNCVALNPASPPVPSLG